jgi:hypothetical protein
MAWQLPPRPASLSLRLSDNDDETFLDGCLKNRFEARVVQHFVDGAERCNVMPVHAFSRRGQKTGLRNVGDTGGTVRASLNEFLKSVHFFPFSPASPIWNSWIV